MKKYVLCVLACACVTIQSSGPSISQLQTSLDGWVEQLRFLQSYFTTSGDLVIPQPIQPTAQVIAQTQLRALIVPLQNALNGIKNGSTQDPDTVAQSLVTQYQTSFNQYVKNYGTKSDQYRTLMFWNLFLPLIVAKNNLKTSLSGLQINSMGQLTAAQVTPSLLAQAQTFQDTYTPFQSFITESYAVGFQPPVPLSVLQGYADFTTTYVNKILSFKNQTDVPVNPGQQSAGNADQYIVQNFNDATLAGLSNTAAITASLAQFKTLYSSSDSYYTVYQLWATYVPIRYYELQFLNAPLKNRNTFVTQYNKLKNAFIAAGNAVTLQPYKGQYNDFYWEFEVAYQYARLLSA